LSHRHIGAHRRERARWLRKETLLSLTRTAVLERMCGPLCEAVLERPGSGAILAGLARSNLLLVPLDHRGQGRVTTLQRWFRWLEDRGGIVGRPMAAVGASIVAARTGRPAEAERWAVAVDRWPYGNPARPDDPAAGMWASAVSPSTPATYEVAADRAV
jgi:hypothetical protein